MSITTTMNLSPNIHIYRGKSGLRQMLIISSNAYVDREQEIVTEKALQTYVEKSWDGHEYQGDNVLLYWHSDNPETARKNAIGDIVYCHLQSHFLIEIAQERPDAIVDVSRKGMDNKPYKVSIKSVWDAIETSPVEWGASIGFGYVKGNKQGGLYKRILKYETSILPVEYAANAITFSEVLRT